jgi:transcriptional regulator with XRE-family HTH domain
VSTLYDRVASKPGGQAALAAARLRREVLVALHQAFAASGLETQTEIARRLNVRKSAVSQVLRGDGNLRITTLAEYLYALGFELDINLVTAGEPRRAELTGRAAVPAHMALNATSSIVFIVMQGQEGRFSLYAAGRPIQMWFAPQVPQYRDFNPVPNSTSRQIIVGETPRQIIVGELVGD